jgi:aminoglycoside 6-adenylyltransferase
MSTADQIFANIIAWGEEEERVRALVLVGSRAQREPADELADFDVAVFARTYEPYVQDDRWLSSIGHVWVYIPEQYDVGDETVPTRLVIYEGGIKVDFAFHTMGLVTKVDWEGAYRVILDKDGIAAVIASLAHDVQHHPPVEQDLSALVREFWFEAYHVAKYLKRGELWLVKSRDWTTKELLLRMIEWHEQARRRWDYETYYMGKHLQSWVDGSTWQSLHQAFAHFDGTDSWQALLATMHLFRQLAQETAELAGFAYPEDVDQNVSGFILGLKGQ